MLDSLAYFALLGLLCGAVGFRMGWRLDGRVALPLVQAALGGLAFASAWYASGAVVAAAAVGAWAVGTTAVSLPAFVRDPARVDRVVIRADAYRQEMLEWLATGRGPESRPSTTLLAHLRELAVYLAAALATANLASIAMGAVLLNYMNAYVATLLRAARKPWTVILLGWNVWSVIRVASYVALGSAAAAPLAAVLGYPAPRGGWLPLAVAGGIGVVVDPVLKLLLSPACGRLLAAAVDLEAAGAARTGTGTS